MTPPPWTTRDRLLALIVFLVALALRVAYIHESEAQLGLDVSRLTQTDNHVFAAWARQIEGGDLLCRQQPHAYHLWTRDVAPEGRWLEWYGGELTYHQAPLYPYFVAAVYALFGYTQEIVGYAQAVLGALTCLLTFVLARRLISPLGGFLAGLLLAFMGAFYFYDAWILRDGPLALLTVIMALTAESAYRRDRPRDWLIAGAAVGLFTLAKETGLPLLALGLLALAVQRWRRPAALLAAAAPLLLGWALVTTPAFVRNEIVGAPTFKLSTRGPEVFVTGNAAGQDGVGWDPPARTLRHILMASNFEMLPTIGLTLATHRAEPAAYLELLWHKTWAYFNDYEVPNNVNYELHRAHLPTLQWGFVSMGFLSSAALLGLLLALPRRREFAVLYALFFALAASVISLYILGRFRLHVLPLFAVFAAFTLDWAVRSLRQRRLISLALAGLVFSALLAFTARPPGDEINESNRDAGLMLQLVKAGSFEKAMRFRDRIASNATVLLEDQPDGASGLVAQHRENVARKLGAIQEAFVHFDEALRWAADSAERHLHVGRGYAALLPITKRGERIEFGMLARHEFEQAITTAEQIEGAYLGLGAVSFEEGLLGQAYAYFQKELERRPDAGQAHLAVGLILRTWQRDVEALQSFRRAIDLGLQNALLYVYAAYIEINPAHRGAPLLRLGSEPHPVYDPELALRHARRALELEPRHPIVRELAAYVLYANDLFDEAVALLDELGREFPERAAEFRQRADAFLTVKAEKDAAR
ncbi:MAG: glycosyltransferase family 39 protein [Planctomycetota bacterium]